LLFLYISILYFIVLAALTVYKQKMHQIRLCFSMHRLKFYCNPPAIPYQHLPLSRAGVR